MRMIALALLLFAETGAAQNVERGPIRNVLTYTTADMNLFVDPTGSDSNPCTSTGTAACLTLQGAINKIPKGLRHGVNITPAAGNYAGFTFSGFTIDPAFQRATTGVSILGALVNSTVATGTATGTATGGTAGSGTTYGTLVDGAQTWTVNDLRGRIVTITGGTGAGQVRRIVSNTATTIVIGGNWTATTGTSTYVIQDPSVFINTPAPAILTPDGATGISAAGIQILNNEATSSSVMLRVQNIEISAATASVVASGSPRVLFSQVKFTNSPNFNTGAYVTLTNAWVASAMTCADKGTSCTITQSLFTQGAVAAGFLSLGSQVSMTGVQVFGIGFNFRTGATGSVNSLVVDCASAASSYALMVGPTTFATTNQASAPVSSLTTTALGVTNCTVGLKILGMNQTSFANPSSAGITGNALTYAIDATWGGTVWLGATSTNSITSGTADIALDQAATTGTFASIPSAGNCLASPTTGSKVCHQ